MRWRHQSLFLVRSWDSPFQAPHIKITPNRRPIWTFYWNRFNLQPQAQFVYHCDCFCCSVWHALKKFPKMTNTCKMELKLVFSIKSAAVARFPTVTRRQPQWTKNICCKPHHWQHSQYQLKDNGMSCWPHRQNNPLLNSTSSSTTSDCYTGNMINARKILSWIFYSFLALKVEWGC